MITFDELDELRRDRDAYELLAGEIAADRDAYRVLAQEAIHALHVVTGERDQLRRRIRELQEIRRAEHRMAA